MDSTDFSDIGTPIFVSEDELTDDDTDIDIDDIIKSDKKGKFYFDWDLSEPSLTINNRKFSVIAEESEPAVIRKIKVDDKILDLNVINDEEILSPDILSDADTVEPIVKSAVALDEKHISPLPQLNLSPRTLRSKKGIEHSEFVQDNKLISGGSWRKMKLPEWVTGKRIATPSPPGSPKVKNSPKNLKKKFLRRKNSSDE